MAIDELVKGRNREELLDDRALVISDLLGLQREQLASHIRVRVDEADHTPVETSFHSLDELAGCGVRKNIRVSRSRCARLSPATVLLGAPW
jgi:hypothetical protein